MSGAYIPLHKRDHPYYPYALANDGHITPALVMQSVPRTDAREISVNVSMKVQWDCSGVPLKYTVIQHPSEDRVIACIVFTKKG